MRVCFQTHGLLDTVKKHMDEGGGGEPHEETPPWKIVSDPPPSPQYVFHPLPPFLSSSLKDSQNIQVTPLKNLEGLTRKP